MSLCPPPRPVTAVLTVAQEAVLAESGGRSKDEPSSEAPVALRSTELYPETDLDNNIIAWDSQDDPENPK